eukprot:scaffold28671_cov84-Amphora_coffeaeformis.AAC.1
MDRSSRFRGFGSRVSLFGRSIALSLSQGQENFRKGSGTGGLVTTALPSGQESCYNPSRLIALYLLLATGRRWRLVYGWCGTVRSTTSCRAASNSCCPSLTHLYCRRNK